MKYHLLTIAALVIFIKITAQEVDNSLLRDKIKKLELAHAHAIFKSDAVALDSLMDDSITVNHPTNRIVNEKRELINLIKEGVIHYTSFERFPEKFLFFKDMVVVMGHEIVTPAKGAPNAGKTLQRRYTDIWLNRKGQWRLTVRHANNVCSNIDGN